VCIVNTAYEACFNALPGDQPHEDGCVQRAIYGNFSGPKAQEIIVSRGKVLELMRPDESGKMQTIVATEVFGQIRALVPFRLTGGNRDFIIVGSDSGRIVILEYSKEKNSFIKVGRNYNMRGSATRTTPRGQPDLQSRCWSQGRQQTCRCTRRRLASRAAAASCRASTSLWTPRAAPA
jgi:hypothetical protein